MIETILCEKVATKQLIILAIKLIYTVGSIQYIDKGDKKKKDRKLSLAIDMSNKWTETLIDCYLPKEGSK